jgi:hypothetical protein
MSGRNCAKAIAWWGTAVFDREWGKETMWGPPTPALVVEHATIDTVTPESTTAALAATVPKESEDITASSVAPEATTAALAGEVPVEMANRDSRY